MSRNGARRIVESSAALDRQGLGDGDLDVVDAVPVPQRFEQAVGKAQREDVLNRLFAEVMIDAIDLLLAEDRENVLVELLGRGEIDAKWLLDDKPAPTRRFSRQPRFAKAAHDRRERRRRRRQIEKTVGGDGALGPDPLEPLREAAVSLDIAQSPGHVMEPLQQPRANRGVRRFARERADPVIGAAAEGVVRQIGLRHADDRERVGQEVAFARW